MTSRSSPRHAVSGLASIALPAALILLGGGCGEKAESGNSGSPEHSATLPRSSQVASVGQQAATPDGESQSGEWLEEAVARYEAAVAARIGDAAQACWQDDVARFQARLTGCTDAPCATEARLQRLATLDGMQPGMTQLRQPLPEAAQLIAVLGPEVEDGVPTNGPVDASGPDVVRGTLLHAEADVEHMGLGVRGEGGHVHVIVFDMDIGNQPGHDALLASVRGDAGRQVRVEGFLVADPEGSLPNFDASRCRLVYRLP